MSNENKEQWSTKKFGYQPIEQRGYQPTQPNRNEGGNGTDSKAQPSNGNIAQSK